MTINEMRMFADAVRRQADEAFAKQMKESDQRIEAGVRARQAMSGVGCRPLTSGSNNQR